MPKKKTATENNMDPVQTEAVELKKDKKLSHYIDNAKLLAEMIKYKTERKNNPASAKISEYIGECILLIANRLATRPNFVNYTFRDEMVGDGIENCLQYLHNFDQNKSSNPFAYLTQIIYYAFIRRIQKEKKQSYTKAKLFEHLDTKGSIRKIAREADLNEENPYADMFKLSQNDIDYWEGKNKTNVVKPKKKKSKAVPKKKSALEDQFDAE